MCSGISNSTRTWKHLYIKSLNVSAAVHPSRERGESSARGLDSQPGCPSRAVYLPENGYLCYYALTTVESQQATPRGQSLQGQRSVAVIACWKAMDGDGQHRCPSRTTAFQNREPRINAVVCFAALFNVYPSTHAAFPCMEGVHLELVQAFRAPCKAWKLNLIAQCKWASRCRWVQLIDARRLRPPVISLARSRNVWFSPSTQVTTSNII